MRRRTVLRATALLGGVALTGCTAFERTDLADVVVRNRTETAQRVTVGITRTDDDRTVYDEAHDIEAGSSVTLADPITEPGTYRVDVDVTDGPSDRFKWALPGGDEAVQLEVAVTEDEVKFIRLAA